jgi:hypothetical protein
MVTSNTVVAWDGVAFWNLHRSPPTLSMWPCTRNLGWDFKESQTSESTEFGWDSWVQTGESTKFGWDSWVQTSASRNLGWKKIHESKPVSVVGWRCWGRGSKFKLWQPPKLLGQIISHAIFNQSHCHHPFIYQLLSSTHLLLSSFSFWGGGGKRGS